MPDKEEKKQGEKKPVAEKYDSGNSHLGSSNAFEKTENAFSKDADNISDEKLDELLDDE
jgi:hypothetical protein